MKSWCNQYGILSKSVLSSHYYWLWCCVTEIRNKCNISRDPLVREYESWKKEVLWGAITRAWLSSNGLILTDRWTRTPRARKSTNDAGLSYVAVWNNVCGRLSDWGHGAELINRQLYANHVNIEQWKRDAPSPFARAWVRRGVRTRSMKHVPLTLTWEKLD